MRGAGHGANIDATARAHPDLAAELASSGPSPSSLTSPARPRPRRAAPPPTGPFTPSSSSDATDSAGTSHLPREFGDFELLEELGRGGMGVVYKARQKSLDRLVALKMVREAHLATDEDRARFRTEAESAARLKHPNIVTVHEVGTAGGQAYLCMEFVGGQTLAEKVRADGPLPPRDAAQLVAVIARAVEHAHAQGILHRDLKPSNILLSGEGSQETGDRGQ